MENVAELRGRRELRQEIQHREEKKNSKETKCCLFRVRVHCSAPHGRTRLLNVAQASAGE